MPERSETSPADARPSLLRDVSEAIDQRRELAQLEIKYDLGLLSRFARRAVPGAVLIVSGLPLLLVSLASLLAAATTWNLAAWSALLAVAAGVPGMLIVAIAWHHLRQNITALQQTREELLEDLSWLREWTGNLDASNDRAGRQDARTRSAESESER